MKTIDEAAKEYAEKTIDTATDASVSELREYAESDFKAGVKFAQQWIPVSENEFPEIDESDEFNKSNGYSIIVLIKENGRIYFGYHIKDYGWVAQNRVGNLNISHWKYIDLP